MTSPKTILVVPCYNEAARLEPHLFLAELSRTEDLGFIFVNDGSSDRTEELLLRLSREHPRIQTVSLPANQGKAEAVRQGLQHAIEHGRPQYVGYWDADLATPLAAVRSFVAELDRHAALQAVFGARVKLLGRDIQRSMVRHYLGRVFATCASVTLDMSIYDTQCGAKLFRSSPILEQSLQGAFASRWIFDVELILRLNRFADGAYTIHEIPLEAWHDKSGSKVKPRDFFLAIFALGRLYLEYRSFQKKDLLCSPRRV